MAVKPTESLTFGVMPGEGRPLPPAADRVNSPDLAGQLLAAAGATAVVCSALDTDPAVPIQAAIVAAAAADVVAGVVQLAKRAGGSPRVMVVADPESTTWAALRAVVARPVRLVPLHNDYPQAHPSLLLFSLLRRRLRPGHLPTSCRAIVVDAAAAADLGRTSPEATVSIAVRDHFAGRTHPLSVPAGVALADVLRFVGVDPAAATVPGGRISAGPDRRAGVGRDGGRRADVPRDGPPDGGQPRPVRRLRVVRRGLPDPHPPRAACSTPPSGATPAAAARYGLTGCIECGICTYVCPTRLPLLASIRGLRFGGMSRESGVGSRESGVGSRESGVGSFCS